MNKLFAADLPLVAKEHWKNGIQQKSVVTTHFSSSEKLPIQCPKYSSRTRYMILTVI